MKKYLTYLIAAALVFSAGFAVKKTIEVNNLKQAIELAEGNLINSFYNKESLEYNFSLVKKEPSKENLEAMARELSFTQNYFESIILLNKQNLNNGAWQEFQKILNQNNCVNYLYSLITKSSLEQTDKDKLKKIMENYELFLHNVRNDTSIDKINNINSLTGSYVEFITALEGISN